MCFVLVVAHCVLVFFQFLVVLLVLVSSQQHVIPVKCVRVMHAYMHTPPLQPTHLATRDKLFQELAPVAVGIWAVVEACCKGVGKVELLTRAL